MDLLKVNLCRFWAKSRVVSYYGNDNRIEETRKTLQKAEQIYSGEEYKVLTVKIRRFKRNNKRQEDNHAIIKRVIDRLPALRKEFVELKYDKLMRDTAIGVKLNMPIITLHRWNLEFLDEVLMGLRMSFDVCFLVDHCGELEDMINKIDERIAAYEKLSDGIGDKVLSRFERKKAFIQKVLQVATDLMRQMNEKGREIIRWKFFTVGEPLTDFDIADRCFAARSLVTTYCVDFKAAVIKRIEEEQNENPEEWSS